MTSSPFSDSTVGYQGAERSGATVQVYNKTGGDFVLRSLDFGRSQQQGVPVLQQVSCQNSLSSGGRFSFSVHVPVGVDVCSLIEPDAWCDISFFRFATSWHVMRGMVDEVRMRTEVTGSGATSVTAQVSGRSFQKAWETTPCWFDQLAMTNYLDATAFEITGTGEVNGTPSKNIRNILFKLFDYIGTIGRSNWLMPTSMPGRTGSITEAVLYDDTLFDQQRLQRQTLRGDLFFPDVNLWQLTTQHYAESMFCELYTDILPAYGQASVTSNPKQQQGLSTKDSRMTIIFRDKPFPLADPETIGLTGTQSRYFKLPVWSFGAQELRSLDLGTSSYEAFNAFMSVNIYDSEKSAGFGVLKSPLWNIEDMQRRGMKRLDSSSPYIATSVTGETVLMLARRARLRDWYCLGAELRQGTVNLWRVHPEIHIGGRLRLTGVDAGSEMTGYVESVRHQWSPQGGASTALEVTRMFIGSDAELVTRLAAVSARYVVAPSRAASTKKATK